MKEEDELGTLTRREGLAAIGTAVTAVALGANASKADSSAAASFDQSNIRWNTIEGVEHLSYHVLNVDRDLKVVDVLFKFAANEKIVLHKHHADYSTFIIQGELRLYDAEGELTEIRPTGSFVQKPGGGAPHTEGGGDMDCIGWFSNKVTDGLIYEILSPQGETIGMFGLDEFDALMKAQEEPVQPVVPD
ncbi:putative Tat (twin-arginine translocation) pathway signal sequence [Roseibium sp. TrichSKD4]|uniref:putative Tat (twin-arginine translocation) pathway signal sequence n=1 Tax=Roseibium sp. TrichSKD4 TaxID=744980 RepID=UPI0001E56531|nr:putative Tat (twin-arginine translocation) pathway signal sequence [Roseibium sp. TrichSKD4]EFO34047.1 putative Tat (twin-arginine translocation) pathway signal sequence [Roseibium sp. TrichSKD4]